MTAVDYPEAHRAEHAMQAAEIIQGTRDPLAHTDATGGVDDPPARPGVVRVGAYPIFNMAPLIYGLGSR